MSEKVLIALDKAALELQYLVRGGLAGVIGHSVIVDVVGALHDLREAIAEDRGKPGPR